MPKGDKFIALTAYLEKCGKDEIKMSFSEIERIIGFRLSDSAYTYPAQWSNSESQSFAFGWLNAGYLTRQVNIPKQTVEFVREGVVVPRKETNSPKKEIQCRSVTLSVEEAIRCIRTYYNETVEDAHGRYLSWQHCYNAFTTNRGGSDENTFDYLALHLAFYLASWGMYRGSSFLLQKDYKVHIPVVKILMEEQYNPLVGITAEELIKDENLTLLEDVSARIRKAYADEKPSIEGITNNATDTLVTKILLGTLGCVPAYDRYYVQAVKQYGISVGGYNKESVRDYGFVKNILLKEEFGSRKISRVKTSDAKLFLIKLQQDGKGSSTIKTVRGVLRPAFQMAVDDDMLVKNPFGFQLAGVIYNDEKTREAITKEQMKKFLKFVHDDNVYCKYYEVFYILFHTGMRISEFCGLTLRDVDMRNRVIDINHQLQRTSWGEYVIEATKTNAGTRKLPMTDDVYQMFQAIIEDRPTDLPEIMVQGYGGFLFRDKNGMPEVAMHWQHRFNHAVKRYNDIFKVQMPNITPHVCRHTYCSNMARARMNPKTLQYLMGHSDISVTMNTYTHLGFDDAKDEMVRLEELEVAKKEVEKVSGEKPISQKMFKAI